MSSLKVRLAKLESTLLAEIEPIHISIFLVVPDVDPDGYICGDAKIIHEPGEPIEGLHKRYVDTVAWPDVNYHHIFNILEEETCH